MLDSVEGYRTDFKAMGSPCEIRLYAESHAEAERIANTVIADVSRLEARYSRYRSDSSYPRSIAWRPAGEASR